MLAQKPTFRFLIGAVVSFVVLTFLIISAQQLMSSPGSYILKSSRPACPSSHPTPQNSSWEFNVEHDGHYHGLSEEQCRIAFPKLFSEVDKSTELRQDKHITFEELDSRNVEEGMVRGIIEKGEVSLHRPHGPRQQNS
jgi:hypothetical protein